MPVFDWDDDKDPLDGFDTEPTPEPPKAAVAPPRRIPAVPAAPPPKQTPAQIDKAIMDRAKHLLHVDEVVEEIEESADVDADSMSEAEWRLEKAQFYRAVISSQLLSSDHPAAVEVETELQAWARNQMEVLLGLRDKQTAAVVTDMKVRETLDEVQKRIYALENGNLGFTDDETAALKAVAARLLAKSAPTPAAEPTKASPPKPLDPIKPAAVQRQTSVTPAATPPRPARPAGRGRPRKNPCSICGQMECGHKANQTKIPAGAQVEKTAPQDTFQGVKVQIIDGQRIVDMPNGVRYKLERRAVQYRDGTIKEEDVPRELSRPVFNAGALPYPSEQEAMNMAAVEGAMSERKIQSNPLLQKIVSAAQTGPERESYVPTPPQRK